MVMVVRFYGTALEKGEFGRPIMDLYTRGNMRLHSGFVLDWAMFREL